MEYYTGVEHITFAAVIQWLNGLGDKLIEANGHYGVVVRIITYAIVPSHRGLYCVTARIIVQEITEDEWRARQNVPVGFGQPA